MLAHSCETLLREWSPDKWGVSRWPGSSHSCQTNVVNTGVRRCLGPKIMPQTPKVNTVGIWMSSVWNLMCSWCFFLWFVGWRDVFWHFCQRISWPQTWCFFCFCLMKQQGIPLISTSLKFVKYFSYSVPPDVKMCQECHPCMWLLLSKLGCVFLRGLSWKAVSRCCSSSSSLANGNVEVEKFSKKHSAILYNISTCFV